MTFGQAFASTYRGGTAFLLACPLLALVPVAFELIQHVAEVHIGLYDSIAAARATEHHPLRMAFGMVKIAALIVPGYWITRFLPARDARAARRIDPPAVRAFAIIVAVQLALAAVQLFALPPTPTALLAGLAGGQVISGLLIAWGVSAPLGGDVGPIASIRIMARQLPWTVAFSIAATLPLMIPHYVLGAMALVGPRPLLWPVLIVDSALVGWLTAIITASGYYAATRAAGKAGVDLTGVAPDWTQSWGNGLRPRSRP